MGLKTIVLDMQFQNFQITILFQQKKSKKRLIQLGEEKKKNIFVVGPLSLENIKNQKFIPTKILENQINFKFFFKKNILISLHPDYSNKKKIQKNVNSLINSLKNFKNIGMIFTSSGVQIMVVI